MTSSVCACGYELVGTSMVESTKGSQSCSQFLFAPVKSDMAEGHLIINVQEVNGDMNWSKSIRGINLGFVSNKHHRGSRKNEGLSFGTEEGFILYQTWGPQIPKRTKKWNVLYWGYLLPSIPPRICDSWLQTWDTRATVSSGFSYIFRPTIKMCHLLLHEWSRKMSSWRGSLLHSEVPAVHVEEDLWRYMGTSWDNLRQNAHQPT